MNRLLELRDFCESLSPNEFSNISKFLLSSTEWDQVERITSTLKHFAALTKLLQKQKFSLSDFFGGWGRVKMEMTKLYSDALAQNLLAEMRKREIHVLNNSVLNAAVFLDPRFQQYMPMQNKENAIQFLSNVHVKLKSIEPENLNNEQHVNNELNTFLNTLMYENECANNDDDYNNLNETVVLNISETLRNFIGEKEPLDISLFDYWEKKKNVQPALYKLATVVHAVPPTQTTVERSFSAMALILSSLRTRISDENLENSLLIRLNRDLFFENTPQ